MNQTNPTNFKDLTDLFLNGRLFQNILIVNTPITGLFLDEMLQDKYTTRIKYSPNDFNNFIETINNINCKFDLILVDPYHEYEHSIVTFRLLTSLLDENGILISHDCYPPTFDITQPTPVYVNGCWCGVTYAAFVENAYENPNLYYSVINNDFGLGIISKTETIFVKKICNVEKQKIFLDMCKNNDYEKAYNYFIDNSNEMINLIN